MKRFLTQNLSDGFSTLEIMLAFFVLVTCVSGIALVTSGNQNASVDTELDHGGLGQAQTLLENARATADANFNDISLANGVHYIQSSDPEYSTQVLVDSQDQCHKLVTSTASWTAPGKVSDNVQLTTMVTNSAQMGASGGLCASGGLPQFSYACVPGQGCQAVASGGAYPNVAACQASCAGPTHLDCVNNACTMVNGSGSNLGGCTTAGNSCSSSGSQPTHLDCVNNACAMVNGSGSNLGGCGAAGQVCGGSSSQSANNCPANLQLTVGKFSGAGNFTTAGYASSVAVLGHTAYLAFTGKSAGDDDLYIVDVSDPQNPTVITALNTGSGSGLNALTAVAQNGKIYVYAASSNPGGQLVIIDATNSSQPTVVSTYSLPDFIAQGEPALSVYYSNNKVYLGTAFASNNAAPEFHVIDVSNPASPALLGGYKMYNGSVSYSTGVNGIYVAGGTAYLATQSSSAELEVLDVADPANISLIKQYNISGASGSQSLYALDDKLYVGGSPTSPGAPGIPGQFFILDITNPAAPQVLGAKIIGGTPYGLMASGPLAVTGSNKSPVGKEFQVWDVSNPASINLCSSTDFNLPVTSMTAQDGIIYSTLKSNSDPLRIIQMN